jgi:hypothetical protein
MPCSKFSQLHECEQATATTETNANAQPPLPPWQSFEEQAASFVGLDHTGRRSPMSISRMNRGGDRRRSCSRAKRRDRLWRTPPSCLSFFQRKWRATPIGIGTERLEFYIAWS